jgi:hypothetical protein
MGRKPVERAEDQEKKGMKKNETTEDGING